MNPSNNHSSKESLVQALIQKYRHQDLAQRYSFFPIKDEQMYQFYKTQEAAIWTSSEMDFSLDKKDYNELSLPLRRIIDYVNAFFSSTDGLIIDNIAVRFLLEAKSTEEQAFYITQLFIEVVHSETYSLIINTLIEDPQRRSDVFESANNWKCIKDKSEWLSQMMESDISRSHRLLIFACGEGIFFTSSFLFIFYFRSKGKLENIVFANEQISKDEGLHRDAGIQLHIREGRIPLQEAHDIVSNAVVLECAFVDEMLPEKIDDLDPTSVKKYVQYLGDHLLTAAGYPKLYKIDSDELPTWMNDIAMGQKSNFYDVRVGNYKQMSLKSALDWKNRIEDKSSQFNDACTNPSAIDF